MLKHHPPSRDSTSWPFKDAPPFSTCTRPTIRRLRGAAPKCIRTCSEQCFMPRDARNLETRAIHHQVPPKNGACWQLAVSDWLRINMEMEGWEKWEPVYQPFNGPRSKYPRRVAVDYELVYSINTASRATGNLIKVQDAHTQTHTHTHREGPSHWACCWGHSDGRHTHIYTQKVLHTGHAAEGTQVADTHTHTHTQRRSPTLGVCWGHAGGRQSHSVVLQSRHCSAVPWGSRQKGNNKCNYC